MDPLGVVFYTTKKQETTGVYTHTQARPFDEGGCDSIYLITL